MGKHVSINAVNFSNVSNFSKANRIWITFGPILGLILPPCWITNGKWTEELVMQTVMSERCTWSEFKTGQPSLVSISGPKQGVLKYKRKLAPKSFDCPHKLGWLSHSNLLWLRAWLMPEEEILSLCRKLVAWCRRNTNLAVWLNFPNLSGGIHYLGGWVFGPCR